MSGTARSVIKRRLLNSTKARPTAEDIANFRAQGWSWLRCLLSDALGSPEEIQMAHIVPGMLEFELADHIFGDGTASRLFPTINGLLIRDRLERAFDSGHFISISDERPIYRWKTIVTSDATQNEVFDTGDALRLRDLDEREIEFPTQHRPAARFLYFHMVLTLLRIRQLGWETRLVSRQLWPTLGPYPRKSMLLRPATSTGDGT